MEMVFFVDEIVTHKTMTASCTVFHKITITAIFGIRRIITPITFLTIEAFVEHLGIIDVATIDDIF